MSFDKAYAAQVGKIIFNDKAPLNVQLLLFTEGHVTIKGIWQDGKGYLGWCPMPVVDKEELAACLANPHNGFHQPSKKEYFMSDKKEITMQPVVSSNVQSVGHDGDKTMRVQFNGGRTYDYSPVTSEEYEGIKGAESVGRALQPIIKGGDKYTCTKILG